MATERFFPQTSVGVRMYRNSLLVGGPLGGLGDCFLLAFARPQGEPYYVLIDCGLFQGSANASDRLQHTMEQIGRATGGRLDAVVLTHQHYNHLAGFKLAWDTFEAFEVGEVWLAWTEDPADRVAAQLRAQRERQVEVLRQMQVSLALRLEDPALSLDPRQAARDREFTQRLGALLDFSASVDSASGAPAMKLANVMWEVGKRGRARYLEPGETFVLAEGLARAYVLGPPRNLAALRRSNPRQGPGSEVYLDAPLQALAASGAPTAAASPGEKNQREQELPFDLHQLQPDEASLYPAYARKDQGWRRIDTDWYQAAGALALQLDGDTNNTSLVLAFELPDSGQVLLFPGDAQVGNWLSWEALQFKVPADDGERTVTAQALLRQTVLYKVSHHGSHNATLREQGLERMVHPELVAMLPVDEAFAHDKKHWEMPYGQLYTRLLERTARRVLRANRNLTAAEIHQAGFKGQLEQHRDYVEYCL